jgi:hypothetical protein
MAYRVSFLFTQAGDEDGGWSINLVNSGTTTTQVISVATALRALFMGFVGGGCYCDEIRMASLANARDVASFPFYGANPAAGNATTDANFQNVAALVKLNTSQGNSVSMWIKGVPMNCLTGGGHLNLTAAANNAMSAIENALENNANGWCCECQNRALLHITITNATSAGVVTAPAHGFAGTGKYKISRTSGITNLNNDWIASVTDANTMQLFLNPRQPLSGFYTGGGAIWLLQPVVYQIVDANLARATSRKTGRPRNLLSGRRKTRKS